MFQTFFWFIITLTQCQIKGLAALGEKRFAASMYEKTGVLINIFEKIGVLLLTFPKN